jgi:pilus assembly protein CpaE
MPSNPILIVARDNSLRTELEATLRDAGYSCSSVVSPADGVAAMRATEFDLIVAEGLAASGAISTLRTARSGSVTPILVVAPAHDVEARIAFLEAGADDVIDGEFSNRELEGRVMAHLIRSGKVRPEAGSGRGSAELIAFFSPKGGVGTTTLAVNTAVLLAGGGGSAPAGRPGSEIAVPTSRVLLIDLDLQFGQVATHLNLMPRYDIGGLATDEQALADPELARAHLTSHSSGLVVLAAPVRPEADFRVTLDHLQRIIELFRPWYDHIIVDLGSRLDPRALWLLEQADAHVFVLFPEIAALRAMSLLMAFLAETTPLKSRAVIVVNHVFPQELLKSRDVENLLRTKPAAEIPYTGVEMIRAVNEGVPLVMSHPASPAVLALREVAQAAIGIERREAAPVRRRERKSLFGRRT